MARTQHLPLYQSAFVYTRELFRLKADLPKNVRHDLGQETCTSSLTLMRLVVMANGAEKKQAHLERLLLEIDSQWVFLRLLYELKAISPGQFKLLSERLADISKQATAWSKWSRGTQNTKKPLERDAVSGAELSSESVARVSELTGFGSEPDFSTGARS